MPPSVTVLATQVCARVPGGTGRYTVELLRALADTRPGDARLQATVCRPCSARGELPVPAGQLPLPYAALARLWERGLPPVVRDAVVHAPTMLVPTVPRSTSLVVTVHDLVPWTHPETLTARGVAFHRAMGERVAREATVVVTPTEAVAEQVRERLRPRGRVVAVPPGATTMPIPSDGAAAREAAGVGATGYLLFVGTAEPRKGLDVLLRALAEPALAEARLVVVGPPGWGDVDVAETAAELGVRARVHVTGRVDDATLAACYAGAGLLALPSRAEGFGLPVLEAMAAGIPVVTSADPALVEVGGGATVVVPTLEPADWARRLSSVLATPDVNRRSAGRRRATDFDWSATARTMWEIYESGS